MCRAPPSVVMERAARQQIDPLPASVTGRTRVALERMLDPRPERRPSVAAVLGGLEGTTVTPVVRNRAWSGAWGPEGSGPLAPGGRGPEAPWLAGRWSQGPGPEAPWSEGLGPEAPWSEGPGPEGPGPGGPGSGRRSGGRLFGRGRSRRLTGGRPRRLTQAPARRLGRRLGRLLGDPVERGPVAARRRRWLGILAVAVVVAGAGVVTAAGLTGGTLRPAAPHTDGKGCESGWYNLDGVAADGCESRSDYIAGTVLTAGTPVRANLVPASASDSFGTHVSGDAFNFCWGALHVTLTAPAQTAERLTIWKGTTKVADALSAGGLPATATVNKPSCFGADPQSFQVTVTVVAATGAASAQDFTLTRDGGW